MKNRVLTVKVRTRLSLSIARQILTRPMQGLNAIIVNSAAEKR